MPLEQAVQRTPAHAQQARGARLVALDELQRPYDVLPFYLDERRRNQWLGCQIDAAWPRFGFQDVQALPECIDGRLHALVPRREHRLTVRTDVAEGAKHFETADARADQRQDGAVVIDDENMRTFGVHAAL